MNEKDIIIEEIVSNRPVRLVISNPKKHAETGIATDDRRVIKLVITLTAMKQGECYQVEKLTKTQAFHINISKNDLSGVILTYMEDFRQLNAWCETMEYDVKESKKGKLLVQRRKAVHLAKTAANNNKKHYLLEEGKPIAPLVELGIFTKEGRVSAAMYDKYKQINRFLEMVADVLKQYPKKELSIVDFGCGKSYLTFILYYYLTELEHRKVTITGLDLKQSVIDKCNETARKFHYDGLHFMLGDIDGYQTTGHVDMVVTLHACDTATDYALYNAISWKSDMILSVPCCQHELNSQIETNHFQIMTKYGIIKERTAALMTDAIRATLLECAGYKTQVLEFIDIAHSPKNIMIRAVRSNISEKKKQQSYQEVLRLMEEFHLEPALFRLLKGNL